MYKTLEVKKDELIKISNNLDCYYLNYPIKKQNGKVRWIEAPLEPLKGIQRNINSKLLHQKRVHNIVHGFVSNRNAITAARKHLGNKSFMCIDIKDFFPSIKRSHVMHCLYNMMPLIKAKCTKFEQEDFLLLSKLVLSNFSSHRLPQGAPTSPTISNIVLDIYGIDSAMERLAKENSLVITRYADDYVLSHPKQDYHFSESILSNIEDILAICDLNINYKKIKYMRSPKAILVNGIVVNEKINVHSKYYDALKLQVFLATKTGLTEQELKKLRGKLAWVQQLNSIKFEKLHSMLMKVNVI